MRRGPRLLEIVTLPNSSSIAVSIPGKLHRLSSVLRSGRWWAVLVTILALVGPRSTAFATNSSAAGVTIKASPTSSQPVGTQITWTASATGMKTPVYRFSVVSGSGSAQVVRDFSTTKSFVWAPLQEGSYTVQVSAKDGFSATSTVQASSAFTINSRVTGTSAVVSATANPLVALYSAPACTGTLTVQFRPAAGSGAWQSMPAQACSAGKSVNVLVAGMLASTKYTIQSVLSSGGKSTTSSSLTFTTGKPEAGLKITAFTVGKAPTAQSDQSTPFIWHSFNPSPPAPALANPIATDLSGNVVWYYDTLHAGIGVVWPVRILTNTVLLLGNDGYHKTGEDVLREIDLAGNPVRETTIDAVNAQLATRGQEPIYMFHHDAMRLPNGDTAVLGATQKKLNGHDVMSDMVLVLDSNFQVVWNWDMFAHFTPPATFPKGTPTCIITGPALCGLPDPNSIDWTHANALDWSTSDGDLLVSFRNLSLFIKIAYQNGKGNGAVIWRLGKGGDFTLTAPASAGSYPWFSNQHNPNFVSATDIVVFDDGNTRCQNGTVKGCQSRGEEYSLDQTNHKATLILGPSLGAFWQALGSAQKLPNGDITFAGGYSPPSKEEEFTSSSTKVYELDTALAVYRAYRLTML